MNTTHSNARMRVLHLLMAATLASLSVTALPVLAAPTPAECQALRQHAASLQAEIRALQFELSTAAPGAKSRLVAEIRRLGAQLATTKQLLLQCPSP